MDINENMTNYTNPVGLLSFDWINDEVEKITIGPLYKIARFFLRKKKLTYKDVYLISIGMFRRALGDEESREVALYKIIKLYRDNHDGMLPEGIH